MYFYFLRLSTRVTTEIIYLIVRVCIFLKGKKQRFIYLRCGSYGVFNYVLADCRATDSVNSLYRALRMFRELRKILFGNLKFEKNTNRDAIEMDKRRTRFASWASRCCAGRQFGYRVKFNSYLCGRRLIDYLLTKNRSTVKMYWYIKIENVISFVNYEIKYDCPCFYGIEKTFHFH